MAASRGRLPSGARHGCVTDQIRRHGQGRWAGAASLGARTGTGCSANQPLVRSWSVPKNRRMLSTALVAVARRAAGLGGARRRTQSCRHGPFCSHCQSSRLGSGASPCHWLVLKYRTPASHTLLTILPRTWVISVRGEFGGQPLREHVVRQGHCPALRHGRAEWAQVWGERGDGDWATPLLQSLWFITNFRVTTTRTTSGSSESIRPRPRPNPRSNGCAFCHASENTRTGSASIAIPSMQIIWSKVWSPSSRSLNPRGSSPVRGLQHSPAYSPRAK